jgi:lipopolysaccharide export system permease protein
MALTVIAVIIDISEKTTDFSKSNLPAIKIFTDYYLGFIPRIDAMLFPLFVFLSVIFFTSGMAGRSEVIAILGNGISFPRFLRPYFIGGIILSAFLWWCNQSILPRANAKWASFSAKYIDDSYNAQNRTFLNNYYFRLDSFSYAGIRYYDTIRRSGNSFFVQTFHNNQMVYNLRAGSITWDTAMRKWNLTDVSERRINGIYETITRHPSMQMGYNFKPRDLQRDEYMKDKLTTPELNEFIKLEKLRGSEIVNTLMLEKSTRDAGPPSVLILTLIGAIVASRKNRGGSGFHLVTGILISFLYILVGRFSSVFAMKGNFDPIIAAWIPNVFFGLLAWILYIRAPK